MRKKTRVGSVSLPSHLLSSQPANYCRGQKTTRRPRPPFKTGSCKNQSPAACFSSSRTTRSGFFLPKVTEQLSLHRNKAGVIAFLFLISSQWLKRTISGHLWFFTRSGNISFNFSDDDHSCVSSADRKSSTESNTCTATWWPSSLLYMFFFFITATKHQLLPHLLAPDFKGALEICGLWCHRLHWFLLLAGDWSLGKLLT